MDKLDTLQYPPTKQEQEILAEIRRIKSGRVIIRIESNEIEKVDVDYTLFEN